MPFSIYFSFQLRLNVQFILYIYILREGKQQRDYDFIPVQACFMITHSSGDFIVKNIRNHHLSTLQIFIIGVAVNFNALFISCYAVMLCFCGDMRTRVYYVY